MSERPEDRKFDPSLKMMQKVGAAIVRDRKVLVVKKNIDDRPEYYMAGGRMEAGETQRETLVRELHEELGVGVKAMEYLGSFEDIAVFESAPLVIHAYLVDIQGDMRPLSEIKEYVWIDRDFEKKGIQLGSIMAKHVIPALVQKGLM